MDVDLELWREYSKGEVETIFNTKFGSRIKGINIRRWVDGTPYIIIFSKEEGPYSDRLERDILYYDGEGRGKDQKLTPANKALINSNETGRPIFGFRQRKDSNKWQYIGILKVIDYNYILKDGYKTYEFKLKIQNIPLPETTSSELDAINERSKKEEPQLTEETITHSVNRKQRNEVFRSKIKEIYEYRCAICGKKRFTLAKYPEVEASHIYPKEKNGSDDLRNGIALCKLHHWAFDNGLLAITNDYHVIVRDEIKSDTNYEEIYKYDGKKIQLPKCPQLYPHPIFLTAHRELHGFE